MDRTSLNIKKELIKGKIQRLDIFFQSLVGGFLFTNGDDNIKFFFIIYKI